MRNVLITGMSGLIGGLLKDDLIDREGYHLTALNRRTIPGIKTYQEDISDLDSIIPAFKNQDVVVHLAANLGSDKFVDHLTTNVIGTYNVYEAARISGVKRVVYASSGMAVGGVELNSPYREISQGEYDDVPNSYPLIRHDQIHPSGIYGVTKIWGEALGRHFSDRYGISVLCVRIGSVTKVNRPVQPRHRSVYLSHKDVCQILRLCIDAPLHLMYDIFFATSNNKWTYRDLSHSEKGVGFVPEDSADDCFEL